MPLACRRKDRQRELKRAAQQQRQQQARSPAEIQAPERDEPKGGLGAGQGIEGGVIKAWGFEEDKAGGELAGEGKLPEGAAGGGGDEEEEEEPEREWLSEEEKQEILYVMAQNVSAPEGSKGRR